MKLTVVAVWLSLLSVQARAAGLESVPLACSGSAGQQSGAILIVDGLFEGLRLTGGQATTYVVYDENEQGMALVNPLEYGMERQAELARYSAVVQIGGPELAKVRARQSFVAALLSGQPTGSRVEVLTCTVQPPASAK